MSPKHVSFILQPVTLDDVVTNAKIGARAFRNDRNTIMKGLGKNPYRMEDVSQDPLKHYLSLPQKIQCIKAVDNETGENMGYVYWGFRGWEPEDVPTLHGKGAPTRQLEPKIIRTKESDTSSSQEEKKREEDNKGTTAVDDEDDDPIKRLSALTNESMNEWMDRFMPEGTKCMFVIGLTVDPKYHGRGVGTALLRWGTAAADEADVFIWVHSSESAYTFYAKEGFEVVGTLDVDLDEYAPVPPPPEHDTMDGKWGHYVFRYMKRMPRV
ncbi:hypothetical protein BGX28_006274 [Mortierella sp. GBA30]|nr:hypothetical protein BGX28_006274 [Mortierella sp. GBA30]